MQQKSIIYLGYVISLIIKANILAGANNIAQPVLEECLQILSELSFRQHRESLCNVLPITPYSWRGFPW